MRKNKKIDIFLMVSIVCMAVSGFAFPFLQGCIWVSVVHKISSVLFCILCVMHILQYKRGKRGKKNVS